MAVFPLFTSLNHGPAYLSLETAFATLGPKLVKSYALDAYLEKAHNTGTPSSERPLAFLREALTCKEEKYPSIAYGHDYRFEGSSATGSGLVHNDTVIHTAFFAAVESDKTGNMAGFRQRRGNRRTHA